MSSTCRACLQNNTASNHIFNQIVNGKVLSEMLVDCATIEVQEGDLLPSHICNDCTIKLVSAWTFRELVRKSDLKLHEDDNLPIQDDLATVKEEPCVKYENNDSACSVHQNHILHPQIPVQLLKNTILHLTSGQKSTSFLHNNETINEISNCNKDKHCQGNANSFKQNFSNKDLKNDTTDVEVLGDEKKQAEDKCVKKNNIIQPKASNEFSNGSILDANDSNSKSGEDGPLLLKGACAEEIKNQDSKKSKYHDVHCRGCNKTYSYNYYHQIHIHMHMGNQFACSICNKLCTNIYQLRKHRAEHQDQHTCYICGENFKTYNKLQYHRQTMHKNDKTAKADQTCVCDICGKSFKSTWSMYYHKIMHKNGKPQTCNICNKEFMNEDALAKHMVNLHNDEKFVCDECGKAFHALNNLQIHKTSHTTERTMPCPTCGKLFPNRRKLQMHLKRHSEDKPYVCEYCNKSFKLNMVLKRHIMIHTGEKPHACKVCGKRFVDGSTVVRHMLTHTGETPFVCQKCPYKCKYKQQFDKHMTKHK